MRKQDGRFNEYPSRNLLINGDMRVDQRGNGGSGAVGEFAFDRWKITTATDMTQIIEEYDYKPSTVHTLSGDGVTTQQITSPASGHWTLPNIPLTARNVQLEEGSVATAFERLPLSLTEMLCYRYYYSSKDSMFLLKYMGDDKYRLYRDRRIVTMRAVPTETGTMPNAVSAGFSGTATAIIMTGTAVTIPDPVYTENYTADAEL